MWSVTHCAKWRFVVWLVVGLVFYLAYSYRKCRVISARPDNQEEKDEPFRVWGEYQNGIWEELDAVSALQIQDDEHNY